MGEIRTKPNICSNCLARIGPLEYEQVIDEEGNTEEKEAKYCPGCGKPVEEVLDLDT